MIIDYIFLALGDQMGYYQNDASKEFDKVSRMNPFTCYYHCLKSNIHRLPIGTILLI